MFGFSDASRFPGCLADGGGLAMRIPLWRYVCVELSSGMALVCGTRERSTHHGQRHVQCSVKEQHAVDYHRREIRRGKLRLERQRQRDREREREMPFLYLW